MGYLCFWYVSLNPLNESYTVELMSQREGNRKETRKLARILAYGEDISLRRLLRKLFPAHGMRRKTGF